MEGDNLLWRRVAALRGIEVPRRGDAPIRGDRFQVRISRVRRKTGEIERARDLVSAPTCQGVIGEIFNRVGPADALGWRRALIQAEGERLARTQPERLDYQSAASGSAKSPSSSGQVSEASRPSATVPAAE
jgi:hypothetical protein